MVRQQKGALTSWTMTYDMLLFEITVLLIVVLGEVERNVPLHYTWKQSPYLSTRTEELGDIINDVQPFRPVSIHIHVCMHVCYQQCVFKSDSGHPGYTHLHE